MRGDSITHGIIAEEKSRTTPRGFSSAEYADRDHIRDGEGAGAAFTHARGHRLACNTSVNKRIASRTRANHTFGTPRLPFECASSPSPSCRLCEGIAKNRDDSPRRAHAILHRKIYMCMCVWCVFVGMSVCVCNIYYFAIDTHLRAVERKLILNET